MKKITVLGIFVMLSGMLFAQKPQLMQVDCRVPLRTDVNFVPAGDVTANQLTTQNLLAFQKVFKKLLKDAMKGKIAAYNPDNPQEKYENVKEMLATVAKTEDLDAMVYRFSDYFVTNYLYTATGVGQSREVTKDAQRIVLMALAKKEDERDRTILMFKKEDLQKNRYKIRVKCKRYAFTDFLNKGNFFAYPVQFYDEVGTLAVFSLPEAYWLKAMLETGDLQKIEEGFKQFKHE